MRHEEFELRVRSCPVCGQYTDTHNEWVTDYRGEVVFYHRHVDGICKPCPMSGKVAALRAVEMQERAVA